MDATTFLLLALPVGLLMLWALRRRGTQPADEDASKPPRGDGLDTVAGWPPEATRVLTAAERQAYQMLVDALPEHLVLAQVPLSRFIRVPTRNSYHEWMRRVGQLCADLVVCDRASQVVAVVELRRPPAKEIERTRKRHERMDRVLRKAGVRVIAWNEEALPHPAAVREQVLPPPKPVKPVADTAVPPPATVRMPSAGARPAPRVVAAGTTIEAIGAAAAPPPPPAPHRPMTTLDEVLDEIDHAAPPRRSGQADPLPSTWFDDLDSAPVPLDKPRR